MIKRCLFLVIACAGAVAAAQVLKPHTFPLGSHGQLQLSAPDSWQPNLHVGTPTQPTTLEITPASGTPFEILLTPIWPRAGAPLPDLPKIRTQVEGAAQGLAAQAVEQDLPVRELGGTGNPGYYFAATDRAPKPNEYKYLNQGIARVGDITVAFTILTNDGQDAVVKSALDLVRHLSHSPGEAP